MSRPPAKAKRRPPDFFQRLARFPSYYGWRASEADENRDFRPPGPPPLPLEADALRRAVLAAPGDDGPRLRFAEWLDRCGDPRGEFIRVQIELARLQPHFGEKATGAFGPNPPAPFPEREGGVFLPSPLGGEGKGVRGISPNPPTPFSEREGGAGRSPGAAEGKDFSPLPFQGRGAGGVRFLPLLDRQRELLLRHAADWLAELAPWGVADAVFRRGFAEAVSVTGRTFISLGDGLLGTAPIREVRLVAVAHLADELGRTANLARLDALDLGGNHLGPDGFAPLARSPHLAG
ncbi:MAG TPA: TIGR02996 domain-containing protein, partial [Gemmataceae bacterium]